MPKHRCCRHCVMNKRRSLTSYCCDTSQSTNGQSIPLYTKTNSFKKFRNEKLHLKNL